MRMDWGLGVYFLPRKHTNEQTASTDRSETAHIDRHFGSPIPTRSVVHQFSRTLMQCLKAIGRHPACGKIDRRGGFFEHRDSQNARGGIK